MLYGLVGLQGDVILEESDDDDAVCSRRCLQCFCLRDEIISSSVVASVVRVAAPPLSTVVSTPTPLFGCPASKIDVVVLCVLPIRWLV